MLIKILFFTILTKFINSTVLGIDFGSEFFKASLISPGKTFEIVENETSKRKTNNAVFLFN